MLRFSLLVFALGLGSCAVHVRPSVAPSSSAQEPTASPTAEPAFPQDWIGTWEGPVEVWSAAGPRPGFRMGLEIAATDDPTRLSWTITYTGDAGSQERPYELVVRDAEAGAFAIDEKNGIVLEARYLGDTLHTWFEIRGTFITVEERLVDAGTDSEAIEFELLSSGGDTVTSGAEANETTSYLPVTLQRARLERVE